MYMVFMSVFNYPLGDWSLGGSEALGFWFLTFSYIFLPCPDPFLRPCSWQHPSIAARSPEISRDNGTGPSLLDSDYNVFSFQWKSLCFGSDFASYVHLIIWFCVLLWFE